MAGIYLDHNATTLLDSAVFAAMLPFLTCEFGNPSSIHSCGRAARAAVDAARDDLARVLHCNPSEIIFTSGGTESCNLAILGISRHLSPARRHVVVSAVEHPAVLAPARSLAGREGLELTVVPVDSAGRVRVDAVAAACRPDTAVVSIMAANNEVGTVQPFSEVGTICASAGVLFHCDASQWFGKLPFSSVWQFGAPLVSLCAHKFGGPKGVGALIVKSGTCLTPLVFGGGQEADRRPGTENVPGIVGLAKAAQLSFGQPLSQEAKLTPLARYFRDRVSSLPGVRLWSPTSGCLPNTVSLTVQGCDSLTLLAALDMAGICASSGSACSVGSLEPSHVLAAMGATAAEAAALVRFSLGRATTANEVEAAAAAFAAVVNQVTKV